MTVSSLAYAQVGIGINTPNPQGVLHLDGAKDNPATGTSTADQQANDFVITSKGSMGVGTYAPNSSAIMDVSSTDKGILLPRMTTIQRDAISLPSNGLQIYNTDTSCLNIYNKTNASWTNLCSAVKTFLPKFIAYRTVDLELTTNDVRYNIPFNDIRLEDLSSIGGSYNPTTGGFTLPPGVYEITYGLMCLTNEDGYQNDPATADVFISSFENTSGDTAGSEIYGVELGINKGTSAANTRNASVQNKFYFRNSNNQTFYLKGKAFNGTGGIISANKVLSGDGSYNKAHLNNFITINKLIE